MVCKLPGCGRELTDLEQHKGGVCYFCRVKQSNDLKLKFPDKEAYGRTEAPPVEDILKQQAKAAEKIRLKTVGDSVMGPSTVPVSTAKNELDLPTSVEELEAKMPVRRNYKETIINARLGEGAWSIKVTIPLELHQQLTTSFEAMAKDLLANYARIVTFGEMAPEIVYEMIERNQPRQGTMEEK